MADREDAGFKIRDRRKYNPDGSPRDAAEPEVEAAAPEAVAQAPITEAAANNVVSFPGESARRQPEPSPQAGRAAAETREVGPEQTAARAAAGRVEDAYNQARGKPSPQLPEASFLSLANMLAVEAAMHLGLIHDQGEEPPPPDLESARHLIDMLGILQAKTRGNLAGEEDNLLESMLADLRMQFVAISRGR